MPASGTEPPADGVPPQRRRVTRRDVARLAGVSDAVVSYTLSGRAPVAPATAERVRDAIRELGYVPDVSAQALRSGTSRAVALIAPDAEDPVLANPFFVQFAGAVERAARSRGLVLFMATSPAGLTGLRDRARDFTARNVDGLLVVPGGGADESADLDALGVPWVRLNTPEPLDGVFGVGVDLLEGARAATTHLIEHGHRRVGFIGESAAEPRGAGWLSACRDRGVEAAPLVVSGYGREDGYRAAVAMLAAADPPRALFAASDLIALGVLRAAHERGIRVPDDLALVSFDGSWESAYAWPPLTTVRQPIERMAESAIELLLDRGPTAEHRAYRGELVVRDSCGRHPGA